MNDGRQIDFELDANIGFMLGYLVTKKNLGKIVEFFINDWNVPHHVHDGSIAYPATFKVGIKPNRTQKAEIFIRLSGKAHRSNEERDRFDKYIFDGLVYGPII